MANRPKVLTQAALAKVFRKSRETIRQWEKAGMPRRRDGFVLEDCIEWREAKIRDEAKRDDEALDEVKERARKLKEDADRLALDNARKRRELVPAHQVTQHWERVLGVLRSRILAARGRWAPRIMGLGTMAEATQTLDALADDLLAVLRESADGLEEDDADGEVAA